MRQPEVTCSICGRTEVAGPTCSLCATERVSGNIVRVVTLERIKRHQARIAYLRKIDGPVIEPGEHGLGCIIRETRDLDGTDPERLTHQECPCCGWLELAGGYCSQCGVPTGPRDWYRPRVSQAVVDKMVRARAVRRHAVA